MTAVSPGSRQQNNPLNPGNPACTLSRDGVCDSRGLRVVGGYYASLRFSRGRSWRVWVLVFWCRWCASSCLGVSENASAGALFQHTPVAPMDCGRSPIGDRGLWILGRCIGFRNRYGRPFFLTLPPRVATAIVQGIRNQCGPCVGSGGRTDYPVGKTGQSLLRGTISPSRFVDR